MAIVSKHKITLLCQYPLFTKYFPVQDLIAQDGEVTDVQEKVTRRNISKAAKNAFAGNALYFGGQSILLC